jgi:hypothetical protein
MSKIAISGASTGTATFTIESPATSTNRTITIPDATTTLVGTDATQTLTNKSIVATQLTGTIAAARLPAGSVLQVVHTATATETTISSTSYVSTGFTATITPTSATSKILGFLSVPVNNSSSGRWIAIDVFRGAVASNIPVIFPTTQFGIGYFFGANSQVVGVLSGSFLDSPNTTSATTYTVAAKVNTGSATICPGSGTAGNAATATFYLMEIAA